MKQTLGYICLFFGLLFLGGPAQSQSDGNKKTSIPKWVSDKGYWVVEGNLHTPSKHTIHFYNSNNELVYREELLKARFNPKKKKIRLKLKEILESAVLAWNSDKRFEENKNYVSIILK
ncbi:MAG TPA: hypothetical protein VFO70_05695 [Chitinophagaceae bacterium]|nr:hypothetical protein [Chitinophagaceae bacterium]